MAANVPPHLPQVCLCTRLRCCTYSRLSSLSCDRKRFRVDGRYTTDPLHSQQLQRVAGYFSKSLIVSCFVLCLAACSERAFGMGVSDGIYMWREKGVDSGVMSRALMTRCRDSVMAGCLDAGKGAGFEPGGGR